jgi:hypothetical protein
MHLCSGSYSAIFVIIHSVVFPEGQQGIGAQHTANLRHMSTIQVWNKSQTRGLATLYRLSIFTLDTIFTREEANHISSLDCDVKIGAANGLDTLDLPVLRFPATERGKLSTQFCWKLWKPKGADPANQSMPHWIPPQLTIYGLVATLAITVTESSEPRQVAAGRGCQRRIMGPGNKPEMADVMQPVFALPTRAFPDKLGKTNSKPFLWMVYPIHS